MSTSSPSPATLSQGTQHPPSPLMMTGGTSKTVPSHHNSRRPPRSTNSDQRTPASPGVLAGAETACIPRTCIVPLALAHPLLTAPYLSPAAAYTLLSVRVTARNWDALLVPLMTCLRSSLYQARPGVKSLPPLELANHIMVSRQTLQRQMVPHTRARPATPAPIYIVQQTQPVAHTVSTKKKNPAEHWDLQAPSLYRLADVQGSEEQPFDVACS